MLQWCAYLSKKALGFWYLSQVNHYPYFAFRERFWKAFLKCGEWELLLFTSAVENSACAADASRYWHTCMSVHTWHTKQTWNAWNFMCCSWDSCVQLRLQDSYQLQVSSVIMVRSALGQLCLFGISLHKRPVLYLLWSGPLPTFFSPCACHFFQKAVGLLKSYISWKQAILCFLCNSARHHVHELTDSCLWTIGSIWSWLMHWYIQY